MSIQRSKIIILGDAGVGKTTLLHRISSGDFLHQYIPTLGLELFPLPFHTNKGKIILDVWDIGSNFNDIEYLYGVQGVQGVIIMCDVSEKSTYNNLEHWHSLVKDLNVPIVVCGNKVDVKDRKVLPRDITFHREKGVQYYDISVKSNYNYDKPFFYLIRKIFGEDTVEEQLPDYEDVVA